MRYFNDCKDIAAAKKLYKKLAFENHPDRGGDNTIMQAINAEYQFFIAKYATGTAEEINEEFNAHLRYMDVISKLANLAGIEVEQIGEWLWISGNTYAHREQLKSIGCLFAPVKKLWYYRDEEHKKSSGGKPQSMEDLRTKYGSLHINLNQARSTYIDYK